MLPLVFSSPTCRSPCRTHKCTCSVGPEEKEATGDGTPKEERMSREEAERLLQSVRDKERQRRKAQAEAESESDNRRPPVRKDW